MSDVAYNEMADLPKSDKAAISSDHEFVRQRGNYDCGVATIANLFQISYKDASERLGHDGSAYVPRLGEPLGVHVYEMIVVAFEAGCLPVCLMAKEAWRQGFPLAHDEVLGQRRAYTSGEIKALLPGNRAALAVPSRWHAGNHWVAWLGDRLIDPSPRAPHDELERLELLAAVILYERGK